MTKDLATKITDALEQAAFGYTRTVDSAGNHSLLLSAPSLTGTQMLQLVSFLAPGGTPLPGIVARLDVGRGITIE